MAVIGCAVRRVSAPGIALANAQMGQLVAVFVAAFGCAVWACLATSWWLALQQPAGGRSQMADGEGREGRWWPVGGLARTKPAALRATRLLPCVVTLGLASNTPRRRPLNNQKPRTYTGSTLKKAPTHLFFFFIFFEKVFIAFLGVSRHGGLKNSEKHFLEIFWS